MLRESSMPYSSLPQEEGEQTYVTTRASGQPHTNTKSRLLTITLVLLLICGVPLMIIAPLALSKGTDRGLTTVNQEVDWAPPHSESHNGGDTSKDNQNATLAKLVTPPYHITIPIPEIKITRPPTTAPLTTPKPTTTTTTTTTTTSTTTTTTTTTTPAPVVTTPVVVPTHSVPKSEVVLSVEVAGKNQSGDAAGTTTVSTSQKGEEGSGDESLSGGPEGGDYNGSFDISSNGFTGFMKNFMTQHEWWTLVAVAVAVALAIAAVITTLAWIVHNRIASRNRRTNLQKVITDLQSRDKVVLLNSEDSEDEA